MTYPKTSGGERVLIDLLRQRSLSFAAGHRVRYGKSADGLCIPDALFSEERVAVFYDGCYWHECPDHFPFSRLGATLSKDRRVTAGLTERGWTVIRMWEHEDVTATADAVEKAVRSSREALDAYRAEHVSKHEPKTWCSECEDWPHLPWPLDNDGYCIRCHVHSDETEYHPLSN